MTVIITVAAVALLSAFVLGMLSIAAERSWARKNGYKL